MLIERMDIIVKIWLGVLLLIIMYAIMAGIVIGLYMLIIRIIRYFFW